jgi:hypothetical protein
MPVGYRIDRRQAKVVGALIAQLLMLGGRTVRIQRSLALSTAGQRYNSAL